MKFLARIVENSCHSLLKKTLPVAVFRPAVQADATSCIFCYTLRGAAPNQAFYIKPVAEPVNDVSDIEVL